MSGISPQTNSDLLALARGSAQDISSVLDRLLSRGEALSQVASVVEQLIDAGRPVSAIHLAKVLVAAGSPTVYNKVRSTLLADNRSLLILYKGGYPDPEIERRLSGTLYDIAENDANPLRREIANAIHDVGSVETLPVLEAIVFDHTPTLKAKQVIANAIDAVGVSNADAILRVIEVRSKSAFLRIVAEAIAAVKNRGSSLLFSTQQAFLAGDGGRLDNAHFAQKQAERYLDSDPLTSMMHIRRGAEALAKDLYRILGHESKGRPAAKMMLEDLMKFVRDSDVPEAVKHCLKTCQDFGNFAAHDQGDQSKYLTRELAAPVVAIYTIAVSVYIPWATEQLRQRQAG